RTLIFAIIFLSSFLGIFSEEKKVYARKSECIINVEVDGDEVTLTGTVLEKQPGQDPSQTYVTLWDDAPGTPREKSGSDNDSSVTVSYHKEDLPNKTYRVYIS